jgi:hypothetical protein
MKMFMKVLLYGDKIHPWAIAIYQKIKDKAKKQWEKMNTAISELDNVVQTPAANTEIL